LALKETCEEVTSLVTKTEAALGVALIATIIIAATVILTLNRSISNVGRIRAIGLDIFRDSNCTDVLTQIDWGLLSPGDTAAVTMYARNSGNVNVTLNYNLTDWSPVSASTYLIVAWNYSGQMLKPFDVVSIQVTLTVSPSISGVENFSYTMNVNAVEVK